MAIREYIVKITDEVEPDGFERFEDEYAPEGELVRCKDCEYYNRFGSKNIGTCRNIEIPNRTIEENWFCADGKRKRLIR